MAHEATITHTGGLNGGRGDALVVGVVAHGRTRGRGRVAGGRGRPKTREWQPGRAGEAERRRRVATRQTRALWAPNGVGVLTPRSGLIPLPSPASPPVPPPPSLRLPPPQRATALKGDVHARRPRTPSSSHSPAPSTSSMSPPNQQQASRALVVRRNVTRGGWTSVLIRFTGRHGHLLSGRRPGCTFCTVYASQQGQGTDMQRVRTDDGVDGHGVSLHLLFAG